MKLKDKYLRDDQGHGKSAWALNKINNQGRYYLEEDIKEAVLEFINRSDMYHAELAKEIFGDFK